MLAVVSPVQRTQTSPKRRSAGLTFEVGEGNPRGDSQVGQGMQQGVGGWCRLAYEDCIDGGRDPVVAPRDRVFNPLAATRIRAGDVEQHVRGLRRWFYAATVQFDVEHVGGQVGTQAPA